MSDIVLQIDQLNIGFPPYAEPLVKELSLTVKKGKTLALVGESGSGKSLSSLAVMGLLPGRGKCISGEIKFLSQGESLELTQATEEAYQKIRGREIGMIFQEPMSALNPSMRCGEQVAEVLKLHKNASAEKAKKEVLELFHRVKLPDPSKTFSKYPHELSGGQRQRVVIAIAIACKPKLLIADEPTTALDVTVQKEILQLLSELQKEEDMGMIFITHDLGVVSEISDEVVVLYKGKMVEKGTTQEILKNPQEAYTKGLIASRPPLERKPKRLLTVSDFLSGKTLDVNEREINIPPKGESPLLEVVDVEKHYLTQKGFFGKPNVYFTALNKVRLTIYSGQTTGLVGESGCGKSTIGRAIAGLVKPEKGKILYRGKDLLTLNRKQRKEFSRKIQLIFQDPYSSLNPRQRIGEIISEPMEVHNLEGSASLRKERVLWLLEKVGLDASAAQKYPHEFSGGQRQRIGIARALAVRPELIICDESVSALDVSVQAQVINLLNDLKDEFGFSYLFISHDLGVVKYMSDFLSVMKSGEIVEEGQPDVVYKNPQTEYTRTLIESIPQ